MKLTGRMRDIALGRSGLPAARVAAYRALWAAQGYEVPPVEQPTLLARARRFGRALVRHAGDRFRQCTLAEIEARLAVCRTCGEFDGTACRQCGCPVGRDVRFRNKLAWRSESCPLGKWPPLTHPPALTVTRNPPMQDVTACITHYMRPKCLERLLVSLQRFYPDMPVLVEDTRGNLSAARNRLAHRCHTTYYLMLEEDFVFTERTDIEKLLTVVASSTAIGGAAGATHEPRTDGNAGRGGLIYWDRDFLRIRDRIYLAGRRRAAREGEGVKYRPCDLVLNFGVFRTELFRAVTWDENLPVMEHTDFFWRAYRDARWHFAYVPEVTIDHFRDRPSRQYSRQRNRSFSKYLRHKHDATFVKDTLRPERNVPSVLLLGVGRCNSTITTKMAARAFGLALGNIDPRFYEHRTVRDVNQALWHGEPFDALTARRALRSLPQPWIIKDPRFRRTLPSWMGPLAEFRPLLVYLEKDREAVRESYARQKWAYDPEDHERCEQLFADWPWSKVRLSAEDLGHAAGMFDVGRMKSE